MSSVVFELQIIDGLAVVRRPALSRLAKILTCEHCQLDISIPIE